MIQDIDIKGMHCGSCEKSVKNALEKIDKVQKATVSHEHHMARLETSEEIDAPTLKLALENAGAYTLSEADIADDLESEQKGIWATYKPLLLLAFYSLGIALLATNYEQSDWYMQIMRIFMGSALLGFSFLKLLDLSGFANAFRGYDLLAKKSRAYAWAYPFIELALGLAYLFSDALLVTNVITVFIMAIGSLGVYQALRKKLEIQCACVGTVFKLPMSKVTLIEDLSMMVMALLMIFF